MRHAIPLLAALLLAPVALAQAETEHIIYLHENPLHALPEVINARVGETLRLVVENPASEGKTPHNLLVCGDAPKPAEACNDRWGFTPMIQPGGSSVITVTMEKAGTFEYYCYIPGHKGGGMVGVLNVAGDPDEKSVPGLPAAGILLAGAAAAVLVLGRSRP